MDVLVILKWIYVEKFDTTNILPVADGFLNPLSLKKRTEQLLTCLNEANELNAGQSWRTEVVQTAYSQNVSCKCFVNFPQNHISKGLEYLPKLVSAFARLTQI